MDLTRTLLRLAARRPHVLLVAAGNGTAARLAVEAELARLGWSVATSPADSDLLVVAGVPGPQLSAVVDEAWRAVPAPRARVSVAHPDEAAPALQMGAVLLADLDHQRTPPIDPGAGDHEHGAGTEPGTHDHGPRDEHDDGADETGGDRSEGADDAAGHHDHGHHDQHIEHGPGQQHHEHAVGEHGGHGKRGHEHDDEHGGGHHGHHGHGGGMEVAGLPMADVGEDRDGLTLDRLHVPLGPVLPDWPPGLVLHLVLQGDVVQEATADVLDAAEVTDEDPVWAGASGRAARELDAVARLLGVLGWADPAVRVRRARDELVAGAPLDRVGPAVTARLRRIRRSRVLRWQLRGVPAGSTDLAALVDARLDAVETAFSGGPQADRPGPDEVAALVVGTELAAARLVVAAADPALMVVRHG